MDTGSLGRRLLVALVIVLVVVLVYFVARRLILGPDRFTIDRTTAVESGVDGAAYRVHEGHAHYAQAADLLAQINAKVVALLRYLRNKYISGDGSQAEDPARVAAVERLLQRYNPDNLAENSPNDPSGDTAYSLDKGAIVAICLRDRGPNSANSLIGMQTLTFVTLHEMSHIALDAIDHPPVFWRTFKWLLLEAEAAGVYTSPNYAKSPATYCGIRVDYNPRYDAGTISI